MLMQWLLASKRRLCIAITESTTPYPHVGKSFLDDGLLTCFLPKLAGRPPLSGCEATMPCVRSQPALLSDTGWAYRKSEANDLESGTSAEDCA